MGWLICLAVILLIALIPLAFRIRYDENGFFVQLRIAGIGIQIYPGRSKNKRQGSHKHTPQKQKKKSENNEKSEKGGSIKDFLPIVRTALSFLDKLRQKIRITNLKMHLTLCDPDPYNLSIKYGRGWAILGNIMPLAEQVFVIKRRDLSISCDYAGAKTTLYASCDIRITFGRLLYIVLYYGIIALKQYLDIKNSKKAV